MNVRVPALLVGLSLGLSTALANDDKPIALKSQKDKISYAVGLQVAESLKRDGVELNVDIVNRAIKDAMTGTELAMTEEEKQKAIDTLRKQRQEEMKRFAEKNKKKSEAFLKENKKKPGVVTLKSGLQYKVLKAGTGRKPERDHMATMHYRGTLPDGTEFDSSYSRGKPAEYSVTGVFPGWQEALLNMREGAHWIVYVPPELAFGEGGLGKNIPPNQVLIMDIELLKTEKLKLEQDAK